MKYITFLRGINLGSKHKVSMANLREAFEELGFTDVKTLLNSGNVLFSVDEKNGAILQKKIEERLEKIFDFHIGIHIRTQNEIKEMVEKNPFKNINVTPQTRLYVTFLSGMPMSELHLPYESLEKNFTILQVLQNAIFSVLLISEQYNTTDAMNIIGKEYGKNVTTRNWNTVVKMAAL